MILLSATSLAGFVFRVFLKLELLGFMIHVHSAFFTA